MVARQQTDAHLGKDLEHALLKRAFVVPLRVLNADVCQLAGLDEGRRPVSKQPVLVGCHR